MKARFFLTIAFYFVMMAFLTTVCHSLSGIVSPEDMVPISQGQNTGVWKGRDVNVEYRYSRGQGGMDLSGTIRFDDHMTLNFTQLRDFHISAIFVDENGKVLATEGITSERGNLDPIPFRKKVAVPATVAGMSFSYQGVAIESGMDGGGGPTSFWQNPVR